MEKYLFIHTANISMSADDSVFIFDVENEPRESIDTVESLKERQHFILIRDKQEAMIACIEDNVTLTCNNEFTVSQPFEIVFLQMPQITISVCRAYLIIVSHL